MTDELMTAPTLGILVRSYSSGNCSVRVRRVARQGVKCVVTSQEEEYPNFHLLIGALNVMHAHAVIQL